MKPVDDFGMPLNKIVIQFLRNSERQTYIAEAQENDHSGLYKLSLKHFQQFASG